MTKEELINFIETLPNEHEFHINICTDNNNSIQFQSGYADGWAKAYFTRPGKKDRLVQYDKEEVAELIKTLIKIYYES